jgi:hypothetical protein
MRTLTKWHLTVLPPLRPPSSSCSELNEELGTGLAVITTLDLDHDGLSTDDILDSVGEKRLQDYAESK